MHTDGLGFSCHDLNKLDTNFMNPLLQVAPPTAAALQPAVLEVVERFSAREEATELDEPFFLQVDRERARVGAWYELFPRSWGGLQGVTEQLPRLAELGFDVVYLPPIHPIGQTNRKGRNNALVADPGDPGSPWAIGDAGGGHDAVHPDLGTLEDVDRLTARAAQLGMDVALDLAINCSADHPWLTQHPQWFHSRPDGTLKYAENPPKKYQDIYNVNWQTEDWRALWEELRRVVDGAAAEHIAVADDAGERIERPFLPLDPDDVGMRGEENRTLRAIPLEPRDEMRLAGFRRRNDVDGEARGSEPRRQKLRDRAFAPRRVAGVDPNELRQQRGSGILRRPRLRDRA